MLNTGLVAALSPDAFVAFTRHESGLFLVVASDAVSEYDVTFAAVVVTKDHEPSPNRRSTLNPVSSLLLSVHVRSAELVV